MSLMAAGPAGTDTPVSVLR